MNGIAEYAGTLARQAEERVKDQRQIADLQRRLAETEVKMLNQMTRIRDLERENADLKADLAKAQVQCDAYIRSGAQHRARIRELEEQMPRPKTEIEQVWDELARVNLKLRKLEGLA